MSDEQWRVGLSRRGFLRGVVGAAACGAASSAASGCALIDGKPGPVHVTHPSWHQGSAPLNPGLPPLALRIASYNVQHYRGMDGVLDIDRTAAAIRSLEADIVAIQEADMLPDEATGLPRLELLAQLTGYELVHIPSQIDVPVWRGNAMLVRHEVAEVRWADLTLPGRDKRGLIDVEVVVGDDIIRVLSCHLGLDADERAEQITHLLNWLYAHPQHRGAIVTGDFNEWYGGSANFKFLESYLGPSRGPSTYPASRPIFHLDRIFTNPIGGVRTVRVPRNALTQAASDHLPIWADIVL